jgi:hypothetical protein
LLLTGGRRPWHRQRGGDTSTTIAALDQTDEDILTYTVSDEVLEADTVSDEALEAAAGTERGGSMLSVAWTEQLDLLTLTLTC